MVSPSFFYVTTGHSNDIGAEGTTEFSREPDISKYPEVCCIVYTDAFLVSSIS